MNRIILRRRFTGLFLIFALTLTAAFGSTVQVNAAAGNLLIIGDSIASGYGLENPGKDGYGALLAEAFGLTGTAYVNLSADGLDSAGLAAALKDPVSAEFPGSFDCVVISIGGNDILSPFFEISKEALGLPAGAANLELQSAVASNQNAALLVGAALMRNQADLLASAGNFGGNLTEIIALVKAANPNAEIYVQTIYNPFDGVPGMETLSMLTEGVISQMNAAITGGAAAGDYTAVDIYSAFKNGALVYTNMAEFDIHPSSAGHALIFKEIFALISPETDNDNSDSNDEIPGPISIFSDVAADAWYNLSVKYVFENNIMLGTKAAPGALFSPDLFMTRGMSATVLYRLAGMPDMSFAPNPFGDVPEDKYYTDPVKWAAASGILSGYGDGNFGPEDYINNQDLISLLLNYASYVSETGAQIQISDMLGFITAANPGIVAGFEPAGNTTRAETAAALHFLLEAINTPAD
ncbi:MAG: GDSL-type esterase/lipase family protein [Oscillospiraceae bacterium]|nr:GDSL-type esterase/lipase family protein [Oscillospiraceae bacterium]